MAVQAQGGPSGGEHKSLRRRRCHLVVCKTTGWETAAREKNKNFGCDAEMRGICLQQQGSQPTCCYPKPGSHPRTPSSCAFPQPHQAPTSCFAHKGSEAAACKMHTPFQKQTGPQIHQGGSLYGTCAQQHLLEIKLLD